MKYRLSLPDRFPAWLVIKNKYPCDSYEPPRKRRYETCIRHRDAGNLSLPVTREGLFSVPRILTRSAQALSTPVLMVL
jgi:hypothetical protein